MKRPDPSNMCAASRRHLETNASACSGRNISIRVDSVNEDRTVAYCSVEQRRRGLLRRTYTQPELVWRAEQALAPLNGLGLLPLINVLMRTVAPPSSSGRTWWSPFDWIQRFRNWLGYPQFQEGVDGHHAPGDPFGLQRALLPIAFK